MKKVLEDFYFGDLQPSVTSYDDNPRLQKQVQLVQENEEILLKLLDNKEKKLFCDMVNAQNELDSNRTIDSFIYGYKLGARMTAESIMDI